MIISSAEGCLTRMSMPPDWLPNATWVHWAFRHFNHWQNFLGSVLGLLGLAWSLWKNHSNSLSVERRRRAHDRNGIRTALSAEIDNILGQCTRWLNDIIPEATRTGQKHIYPPSRFKTPIYDILRASVIHLSEAEITKLIQFHGQINHMTRELLRLDLDNKDVDFKRVYRMNTSLNIEDDTFSIEIGHTGFFEKRLRDLKNDGEAACAVMISSPHF